MKSRWLLILLGIVLLGCCAASENNSDKGELVKKFYFDYHHSENCSGHTAVIGKVTFIDDGHEMNVYFSENAGGAHINSGFCVVHSPNCKKCNPEIISPIEEEPKSSYWGW